VFVKNSLQTANWPRKRNNGILKNMENLQTLKHKVFHSLVWNSFEAIAYQAILFTHQCLLFWLIDRSLYAGQSTLFAGSFLGITLLNVALESSMISSFLKVTTSQKNFKRFLIQSIGLQALILFFGTLFIGFCLTQYTFTFFAQDLITPFWIFIIALFITSEGTKKNLRALLHLAFQNKQTAWIEVGNIIVYVSSIWIMKLLSVTFSLLTLILPFLVVSVITNICLLKTLHQYYTTLPQLPLSENNHNTFTFINKNRLFLYGNELSRLVFSSNFLLPFFACTSGLKQAGIAAFINSVTHCATFFIQKIFGASGAALFAGTTASSLKTKQAAFTYLNQKCFYVLLSILMLFSINFSHFIRLNIETGSVKTLTLTYIFFLAHFLENIFVLYEKLFAAEKKAHYTLFCNLISLLACCLLVFFCRSFPMTFLLLGCITLRFGAFLGLALSAKRIWNLDFTFSYKNSEWIAPLVFSLLCYCILFFKN